MKKPLLTAGLLLLFTLSHGQTKLPVLFGIDVLKPLLFLVKPNQASFRLAEATVKIPLPSTRYLSVVAGYGQLQSGLVYRNMWLNNRGYYLKVGTETQSERGLVMGWHGLAALANETGTYQFDGPTFGNYVAAVPERHRLAVGVEGVLGHQFSLSDRLLMRVSGRVTTAVMLGSRADERPTHFVPGIGQVAGNALVYSVGLGLHLFYQLPLQRAASSDDPNH